MVLRDADTLSDGDVQNCPMAAPVESALYFIELFHDVLYKGQWPRLGMLAAAALIAVTSLGIGYAIFKSHEDKMVFRL